MTHYFDSRADIEKLESQVEELAAEIQRSRESIDRLRESVERLEQDIRFTRAQAKRTQRAKPALFRMIKARRK